MCYRMPSKYLHGSSRQHVHKKKNTFWLNDCHHFSFLISLSVWSPRICFLKHNNQTIFACSSILEQIKDSHISYTSQLYWQEVYLKFALTNGASFTKGQGIYFPTLCVNILPFGDHIIGFSVLKTIKLIALF